jgi:hypothetical protein
MSNKLGKLPKYACPTGLLYLMLSIAAFCYLFWSAVRDNLATRFISLEMNPGCEVSPPNPKHCSTERTSV